MEVPRFVKWVGGKQQLLSQLTPLFPDQFNQYFEPFVGGGAMMFHVATANPNKKIFISDVNHELIDAYEMLRDSPDKVIRLLKRHKAKHSKDHYYSVRSQKPAPLTKAARAARLIYLNRTCYNGLHRVNSKGEFNVPMGRYNNPDIVQEAKLRRISILLQNVKMQVSDFTAVLKYAKKGDFVYFDPPYYPLDNKSSFTRYATRNFLEDEQMALAKTFATLDKKGCFVMLSNSNTAFIRGLYKKFDIHTVKASRLVNSDSKGRGKISEIVVTNY